MREFWVRITTLILIVSAVMAYNSVIEKRNDADELAKMSAQLESIKNNSNAGSGADSSEEGSYADGTYTGSAEGFGGEVDIEVTVESGKISNIEVTSAEKEDGAYLTMAEDIIPAIIETQSAEVDTISGATFSSTAIKNATKEALDKAVK